MFHPRLPNVVNRITAVCEVAAPRTLLLDLRRRFERNGLGRAVRAHDTPALFDWLVPVLSYQGVSDAIAWRYMDEHGTVTHADIASALAASPSCPRLRSHWHFAGCGFTKAAFTCADPDHIARCPLPRHDLRNGRLNQTAYALHLFLRDVCDGDLVAWLDRRLALVIAPPSTLEGTARLREALLDPLASIVGTSFKVWSMALADLLLAGDADRPVWIAAGASLVAVDTLVHNWLHRSGCLADLDAAHPYGPACYRPGGCAAIIAAASRHIDARPFCPEGPSCFPRLVQKAIWLFCSDEGVGWCNGNRIDDRKRCQQRDCPLVAGCSRLAMGQRSQRG